MRQSRQHLLVTLAIAALSIDEAEMDSAENQQLDWRSWPGGGGLAAMVAADERLDWRHLDGHFPFQEEFLHPSKKYAYQSIAGMIFRTLGVPLEFDSDFRRRIDRQSPGELCKSRSAPSACYRTWVAETGTPVKPASVHASCENSWCTFAWDIS
eukprot:TRINITY_DN7521_c0_g1_i1.p1 TRINITY_DN7521_c0_g1~~TRINITY_DN7521_c0_g1_i1.p1  ORF type:complete len:154 (+),score=19.24 TRINITY_DN7521_c0_g1_i1:101-562(+)